MRHFPKWMLLIVIGFSLIATAFVFLNQSFRYNDITQVMDEAAQSAITQNINEGIRTSENRLTIIESKFENDFKVHFKKLNTKINVKNYDFQYRKSEEGFYKSIKIKVTDDEDTTYETNYVTDFEKSNI